MVHVAVTNDISLGEVVHDPLALLRVPGERELAQEQSQRPIQPHRGQIKEIRELLTDNLTEVIPAAASQQSSH